MLPLEALIFDVDGTLADTERDGHRVAFNRAFEQAGLDWHWSVELYAELLAVTGGKERMAYYLEKFNTRFTHNSNTPQLIRDLHKSKTAFYTELLSTGAIPLRPGVKRLIEEARAQGLRIAISTTTTPANVSALLEHALAAGSDDWFEVIAAGDIVPAKKPAADIYLWALERLKLKPSSCLALEDSENGIKSSLGASLKTVITINDYTRTHDFSGAALVLSDMGEPDRPFKTLAGDNFGSDYLDLNLLRKIHAAQAL
ncbi:Xylulose-1,5-bisphosphate phosphatase CbbY, converts this Rubisco inhibiting byproduct to xylulose-5P [hydrothermal vent metagenome]|uniref:Xylulose-1,5-bisphosphate phosphatase CbbY, converts this Rubisco inhibiting byproduct to xylulose-5P n=1 Tax=hydrothermal vent metagenome TaxID=652676 RepID=A0A3B0XAG6_9ZZZZ